MLPLSTGGDAWSTGNELVARLKLRIKSRAATELVGRDLSLRQVCLYCFSLTPK